MAEVVNKRIQDMISELEQMQRIELYTSEEIREISRKRKEFEYKIQRQTKQKDDYANYIAYELALLEDISLRRQQMGQQEQKVSIEYAITKRLNRIFKQFIFRFQNDVEIYFQYIKFCHSVGFKEAISGIIGKMLQMHGDKPKMWQMAAKWEHIEQNNVEAARVFLLKGIHRHPDAEVLYLDLFNIELTMAYQAQENEDKEKYINRADIVWRNGKKNISNVCFLFRIYNLSSKFDIAGELTQNLKSAIWAQQENKEIWTFIANSELKGNQWNEINDFVNERRNLPIFINRFMSVYEEALKRFPEEKMCTKYIHALLSLSSDVCSGIQNVQAVKEAWMFGHRHGLLTESMYSFGIELFHTENSIDTSDILQILDVACKMKPMYSCLWKEKLGINKGKDEELLKIVEEGCAVLGDEAKLDLWNLVLDYLTSAHTIKNIYKKFHSCENRIYLSMKPKLLQITYKHRGLKATRQLYDEFVRTPPIQLEVHNIMIQIEMSQPLPSYKSIQKCYECEVQHLGADNCDIWIKYIEFDTKSNNGRHAADIYRRAVATLNKQLCDEFIKLHTLSKLK